MTAGRTARFDRAPGGAGGAPSTGPHEESARIRAASLSWVGDPNAGRGSPDASGRERTVAVPRRSVDAGKEVPYIGAQTYPGDRIR